MNTFKITFEDGNSLVTGFNGTLEDAMNYYFGNGFEFDENMKLVKAVKVEEVK